MGIILRSIPIAGSLLLLGSVILPFIEFTYIPAIGIPELRFIKCKLWSHRIFCEGFGWPTRSETWFSDYWLHDFFMKEYQLSTVMVFLFLLQIFALIIAVASIISPKRAFVLIPVILCPIVAGLMICTFIQLSRVSSPPGAITWINYLHSYWLTYLAEFLFIINLIIRTRARSEKVVQCA